MLVWFYNRCVALSYKKRLQESRILACGAKLKWKLIQNFRTIIYSVKNYSLSIKLNDWKICTVESQYKMKIKEKIFDNQATTIRSTIISTTKNSPCILLEFLVIKSSLFWMTFLLFSIFIWKSINCRMIFHTYLQNTYWCFLPKDIPFSFNPSNHVFSFLNISLSETRWINIPFSHYFHLK